VERPHLMRHLSAVGFSIALLCPFSHGTAEELVINSREALSTARISAPLVTIRLVTTKANLTLLQTRITKDLIVTSATAFPEVQARLDNLGVSDPASMEIHDLVSAIRSSDYADRYLYDGERRMAAARQLPVAISRHAESEESAWDA